MSARSISAPRSPVPGVCLTVVDKGDARAIAGSRSTASAETLAQDDHRRLEGGHAVNLERPLRVGDELGGHIVTGHVDGVAKIVGSCPKGESRRITLRGARPSSRASSRRKVGRARRRVADRERGRGSRFGVNIIPHTLKVTTFGAAEAGRQGQSRSRPAGALRRAAGRSA